MNYLKLIAMTVGFIMSLTINSWGAQKTVTFGASLALTGNFSREGQREKQSYEFWKDYVNSKGGITVGDEKYKVKIIYYDDESDPMKSAKLTEKLIVVDKVDFLIGPYGSGGTFAASAVSEKYQKIMISTIAGAERIYNRGYKWIFGVFTTRGNGIAPFFDMVNEKVQKKPVKVAILCENLLFPQDIARLAREGIEKYEMELIHDENFSPGVKDLSSVLLKIARKKPDVFFLSAYMNECILAYKQIKELKIYFPVIEWGFAQNNDDWRHSLGDAAQYTFGGKQWDKTLDFKGTPVFGSTQNFVKLWVERFDVEPDFENALDLLGCVAYQLAIERAGSFDQEKVRDELLKLDVISAFGEISYMENGQLKNPLALATQIQSSDSKVPEVIVWPEKFAQVEPIIPMPSWEER